MATTPQTRLSTINTYTATINDKNNSNKFRRNDSANISFIMEGGNTPDRKNNENSSNKYLTSNDTHHKYANSNTINNSKVFDQKAYMPNRSFIY